MTPAFDPGPNPYGIPKILVGALGPKMNQMAAEVADGILVMPFNSERHMRERTMPAIERGLDAAGRTRADIEVTTEVIVGVGRTDEELEAARGLKSTYSPSTAPRPRTEPVLDAEGWGDLQPELNALSKQGRWADMTNLITDDLMHTIAIVGSPDEVAAEIMRRYGDCDRVCTYFPGYKAGDDLIAELATAVHATS